MLGAAALTAAFAAAPAFAAIELEPGTWQDTETGTENGRPAKPKRKNHMATPRNGRSQPKPARLSSVTGTPSSRSRAATTANEPSDIAEYGIR